MRLNSHALITALAGVTLIFGVSSCGGSTPSSTEGTDVSAASTYGLLQAGERALHYLIDSREKDGNSLKADVWLYQSGRVVVTADMANAGSNPKAQINLRLTNREQETLWQTEIRAPFCEEAVCDRKTRQQVWTFEIGPRRAARVANVWMPLAIVD